MNRRRVLIETLWNVKTLAKGTDNWQGGSINRNIVECKGSRHSPVLLLCACINRNIVECKVANVEIGDNFSLY